MTLIRGNKLNAIQRNHVLNAYPYRWTVGNAQRSQAYGLCPVCKFHGGQPESSKLQCRQHHPTTALHTDEQWLEEHAFWIKKDNHVANRAAEPAFMAH